MYKVYCNNKSKGIFSNEMDAVKACVYLARKEVINLYESDVIDKYGVEDYLWSAAERIRDGKEIYIEEIDVSYCVKES